MEAATESVHPPLFRRHARRPRLTRLLDESRAQAILVTAPAGYGKTTLALEWLQGKPDAVWYRATNASADVAAFSAGVADVIAPLVPGAGERLKQRLRVADMPERAARPLAELLAEDISDWPKGALLVVDDYHLVANSEPVEAFFDWLLTLAPQLRVLVTSRRRPRWASARRILYGEIAEIGRDQLAMNAEEAGRVLGDRSSDSVRALVDQADGWPALIGLAALTATREIPGERVSEALYRYFAEEVIRRETPEVERFMLLASVPSAVDGRVLRDVLGIENPAPTLERLVAEGLLHPAGDQFRLHPLLRSFLRRRLETEEPTLFRELTERAFADASRGRRWEQAFELAFQADSVDRTGSLLERATPDLLAAGQTELLQRLLDESGALVLEHPGAALARCELLIRQGRSTEAAVVARALALRLPAKDDRISRAWYLAGLAFHLMSKEVEALHCHLQAKRFARTRQEQSAALWGAYIAAVELGIADAQSYLAEMEALDLPDLAFRLRVATGRMGSAIANGSLKNVIETIEPLLPFADSVGDPMIQSSFLSRVAETQVLRAHYEAAHAVASRAIAIAEHLNLDFAIGLCLLPRIGAEIGLRRFKAARKSLGLVSRISLSQEDPYLELAKQVVHLKLALSDPRQTFRDPRASSDVWERSHVGVRGEFLSLRALYAASRGNTHRAIKLSADAQKLSSGVDTTLNARFAELIAQRSEKRPGDSFRKAAIELVLECSKAETFDPLVLACRSDRHIPKAILGDATAALILKRTLLRSADYAIARRAGLLQEEMDRTEPDGLVDLLTSRELEVLRLLSRGLSNSAIAEELVISESTAKVHVHHILEKLGVRTRLQAALKARELQSRSD